MTDAETVDAEADGCNKHPWSPLSEGCTKESYGEGELEYVLERLSPSFKWNLKGITSKLFAIKYTEHLWYHYTNGDSL